MEEVVKFVFMTRVYSTNGFDQPIFHVVDDIYKRLHTRTRYFNYYKQVTTRREIHPISKLHRPI